MKKVAKKQIIVLDLTVTGGKSYNVLGVFSSERQAKLSVKAFIDEYNKTRDIAKGEVEYQYKDDIWFTTDGKELVFPFGPNAEFRARAFTLNSYFIYSNNANNTVQ